MFTKEESNNLRAFLARVDLKGAESELFVLLVQKIMSMTEKEEAKETAIEKESESSA